MVVLCAGLLVIGPPLSLMLLCLTLRLLGVPKKEVRKKALKFADRWIDRYDHGQLASVASELTSRRSRPAHHRSP
jgi:hypothetical protein